MKTKPVLSYILILYLSCASALLKAEGDLKMLMFNEVKVEGETPEWLRKDHLKFYIKVDTDTTKLYIVPHGKRFFELTLLIKVGEETILNRVVAKTLKPRKLYEIELTAEEHKLIKNSNLDFKTKNLSIKKISVMGK